MINQAEGLVVDERQCDKSKAEILRRGDVRLAVLIVVWDVVEGTVAVTAGIAAGSIALVGYGIDSSIEVFAAASFSGNSAAGATPAPSGVASDRRSPSAFSLERS